VDLTDESVNRHRHERRSSPEDLDVRRSSDPPGRQPPSYDQPPARRALGAPGGECFLLLQLVLLSVTLYMIVFLC